MGAKSSFNLVSQEAQDLINRHFRDNRLTLDEILADVKSKYPDEKIPSRSALGRKKKGFDEMAKSLREIDAASRALVAELGEGFGDKSGGLLADAITTLAANMTFKQLDKMSESDEDVDVEDVLKLARAARAAQETRSLSLKERQQIEKIAREKLLSEQSENLEKEARQQGMSEDQVQFWRERVLGIK